MPTLLLAVEINLPEGFFTFVIKLKYEQTFLVDNKMVEREKHLRQTEGTLEFSEKPLLLGTVDLLVEVGGGQV